MARPHKHILSVNIAFAEPETIRSWSFGEVMRPETINYRTYRAEKDGLFCERIFGPQRNWECRCGKYMGTKYAGRTCERCGVLVTHSRVRRKRFGHIDLAVPVIHSWLWQKPYQILPTLLGMDPADFVAIVYYQRFVVTEPGPGNIFDIDRGAVMTEEAARFVTERCGERFQYDTGGRAIETLLRQLDLRHLAIQLNLTAKSATSQEELRKTRRRRWIVRALLRSRTPFKALTLRVLPVLPPDLRPLVLLGRGNFATSDLNDLYRRIINRNIRLKRLMDLDAPAVILRNEKRCLQQAVDALIDNSRCRRPVLGARNRPLKSLTDMIKGKQGRFRENLLGKRVDYSAAAAVVPDPQLAPDECALPERIAAELLLPFIINHICTTGICDTIKASKKLLDKRPKLRVEIARKIAGQHNVLIQRFPTTGRRCLQCFRFELTPDRAVHLPPEAWPLVCIPEDQETVQVHLLLSNEARSDVPFLSMPVCALRGDTDGQPDMLDPGTAIMLMQSSPGADKPPSGPARLLTCEELAYAAACRLLPSAHPVQITLANGATDAPRRSGVTTFHGARMFACLGDERVLEPRTARHGVNQALVELHSRGSYARIVATLRELREIAGDRLSHESLGAVPEARAPEPRSSAAFFFSCRRLRATMIQRDYWRTRVHQVARHAVASLGGIQLATDDCGDDEGILVGAPMLRRLEAEGPHHLQDRSFLIPRAASQSEQPAHDLCDWHEARPRLQRGCGDELRMRSPFACRDATGVCQRCFADAAGDPAPFPLHAFVGIRCALGLVEPLQILLENLLPDQRHRLRAFTWFRGEDGPSGGGRALPPPLECLAHVAALTRLMEGVAASSGCPLSPVDGVVTSLRRSARLWYVAIEDSDHETARVSFTRRRKPLVTEGHRVRRGQQLARGRPALDDLAAHRPRDRVAWTLFLRIMRRYRALAIDVDPRNVELLIREMLGYCLVVDPGDSDLEPDAVVPRQVVASTERDVTRSGGRPPQVVPLFLGARRLVSQIPSLLVRAAYDRADDVLLRAAILAGRDSLTHPAANAMVGNLIR